MGVVNTQYTFAANDVITSTKMNDIIDQTTVTDDAILGNTLEVAGGKLKVRAQGITSNELATNAVTYTQIATESVTFDKLSVGGPTWDNAGLLYSKGLRLSSNAPVLQFNETDTGKQWFWFADGDGFSLRFNDYNTYALGVDGSGNVTFFQNAITNGTLTVNGAASFASAASFNSNVSFNSGAITAKGYAGSATRGILFLGDTGNGYLYNNGVNLEFSSPTGGISHLSSSGTIWTDDNTSARVTASKLSGAQTGSAPIYGARAFGAIALTPTGRTMYNSGGNIGSVTRIDSIRTQVNFAVKMPYVNYVVVANVFNDAELYVSTYDHQTSGFKIRHSTDTSGRSIQFSVFA